MDHALLSRRGFACLRLDFSGTTKGLEQSPDDLAGYRQPGNKSNHHANK